MLVHVADLLYQAGLRIDRVDARELRQEGRGALGFDGRLVHTGCIEGANLLFDGGTLSGGLRLHQDVTEYVDVLLGQSVKASPTRLVGRYRIVFHPVAARVTIEIDTGIDALVDRSEVETHKRGRRWLG